MHFHTRVRVSKLASAVAQPARARVPPGAHNQSMVHCTQPLRVPVHGLYANPVSAHTRTQVADVGSRRPIVVLLQHKSVAPFAPPQPVGFAARGRRRPVGHCRRRPVGHCVSRRRPRCCGHAHPVRPRCSSLCGDVPVAGADARGIVPAHDTSWLCHRRRWRRCRACTLVPVEGVCVVHRAAQGRRLSSWAWTRAGGRKATISSWFIRSSTAKKSPACDRRVVAPAIDTWKRCLRRKRPGAWLGSWCPGPPRGRFDEVWRCDGWIAVGPQGGRGGDHSIAGIAAGTVGLCARGLRS